MARKLILLCTLCLSFAPASAFAKKTERKPASYSAAELEKLWRPVGHNQKKLVTSNSFHFWAWMSKAAPEYVPNYLGYEGVVMGDPHPRNVFDYHGGVNALAVADIDDGGRAPLLLDIVRYITYLEAAGFELKIGQVFSAYQRGLNGQEDQAPGFLAAALQSSPADMLKRHEKWVDKRSHQGLFDYEKLELTPMSGLNHGQKADLEVLAGVALKKSKLKQVFDRAYRVNDTGSSAGMSRYWLLVGNAKPQRIYEFKELGRAAVDFYRAQPETDRRVQEVVEAYSEGFRGDELDLVQADGKFYWMRLKHIQEVDLDSDDFSFGQIQDFSVYLANWMGLMQVRQSDGKGLAKRLASDKQAKESVEALVRAYLAEVGRLNQKFALK